MCTKKEGRRQRPHLPQERSPHVFLARMAKVTLKGREGDHKNQGIIRLRFSYFEMATTNMRFGDMLDGAYIFSQWKERITLVLMDTNLWDFVNTQITTPLEATPLTTHKSKDIKARHIIMDEVKDHVIPHISRKNSAHEM